MKLDLGSTQIIHEILKYTLKKTHNKMIKNNYNQNKYNQGTVIPLNLIFFKFSTSNHMPSWSSMKQICENNKHYFYFIGLHSYRQYI